MENVIDLFTGENLQRLIFLLTFIGLLFAIGWGIFIYLKPRHPPTPPRDKEITKGKIIDALGEMPEEERGRVLAAVDALYGIERTEPGKTEMVHRALSLLKEGNTSGAEDILRAHLESRKLAGRDALREAAATARHLGAFVYLHDTKKALESYREAARLDPEEPDGWLQLGRVALRAGDSGEALRAFRELARRAEQRGEIHWQAIAQSELGDLDALRGDTGSALARYRQAESLLRQWAKLDPDDPRRQRDLSVSFERVGDIYLANGDGAKALAAYQEGLSVREKLTELDPPRVQWKTDVVVSFSKMAALETDKRRQAQWLHGALAILEPLAAENRLSAEQKGWVAVIKEALVGLESLE
uniref:Tetratricopeptide repeat-containing protein n=1 Tax=Candidatus Kentrum sp. FW TaxID=2126338 RepID=A0A450T4Z0_9GAMM|nr:MAG: Tetratricopeptide repeat-containing protein [Candidatus Kentron sp. FW]